MIPSGTHLLARGEQEGAHGGGQANAYGAAVGAYMPHGVKHRHARRDGATRRVDIDGHVPLGVSRIQVQQLRLRMSQCCFTAPPSP